MDAGTQIIVLSGLRGGAGTTSLAAMLSDSLCQLEQTVLAIDLNPSDLLRLHFNIDYGAVNGWAYSTYKEQPWAEHIYKIASGLWVLPYGYQGLRLQNNAPPTSELAEQFWRGEAGEGLIQHGKNKLDWIIIDAPICCDNYLNYLAPNRYQHFLVAPADIAAHILLGQQTLAHNRKIVINQRDPTNQLSESIVLDWMLRYEAQILPIHFPKDNHIQEALAHKMPASRYFPDSEAAKTAKSLAIWCLSQRRSV